VNKKRAMRQCLQLLAVAAFATAPDMAPAQISGAAVTSSFSGLAITERPRPSTQFSV
jgi:hypothetical protein